MRALARLRSDLIRIEPPWRTFGETIAGLVGVLAAARELPPGREADAIAAVTAREAEASTALLDIHAAVPHARLADLTHPAIAVTVSSHGLYEAVPTVPIHIVALVLSPPTAAGDHLEALATIATLLRSNELRASLLAAGDGTAALAAIRSHARLVP
jgi:mannitol/fructose-specific phosphotransferase system IIA component (Ntr-type)